MMADKERWHWIKGTITNEIRIYEGGKIIAKELKLEEANLICALYNAAIKINPPNPMAVAEGMEECIKALKAIRAHSTDEGAAAASDIALAAINKPATKEKP